EPTLTLGPDGRPIGTNRGTYIEFFDGEEWRPVKASADDGDTRKGLDNGFSFEILQNECGIRWTAKDISPTLKRIWILGKLKMRITATISCDVRLNSSNLRLEAPKWSADNTYRVIVNEGYRYQKLQRNEEYSKSRFADDVDDGTFGSDEADDRDALLDYEDKMSNSLNRASLKGSITVHGIDDDSLEGLSIGTHIDAIDDGRTWIFGGRGLTLNTDPGDQPTGARIVQMKFDVQNQSTTMNLEARNVGTTR
ncbi:MAG: hypothetical protein MJA29_06625, partial [Candidatus Omnitrophica bacterium]|nr:hypothetical protein [Candidatus Omnitrophota bacterium]